jgi:hypothetical protein
MVAVGDEAAERSHSGDLRDLIQEFRRTNVVVICGAGLSKDPPTCLPLGGAVKAPFHNLILDAIQTVDRELSPGLASRVSFPPEAIPSMPERLLEAFHNVFGDDVFTFLDKFYRASAAPNHNHKNLARLATGGFLGDIVTLNFDYAIETAFREAVGGAEAPLVCTTLREFSEHAHRSARLRVHKPHGTLRPGEELVQPVVKYNNILYTVQRIGTALDNDLVTWLRGVIRDRSVLLTCYSADDLDVFPALQQAMGSGVVFWNWRSKPPSHITAAWLRTLRPRPRSLRGDVGDILAAAVKELCPPAADRAGRENPYVVSLDALRRGLPDAVRALLAGALLCHETELREHAPVRDALINCLEQGQVRDIVDRDPRMAILLDFLAGGCDHQRGDIRSALQRYRAARQGIRGTVREGVPLPAHIEVHIDINIAYDEAWPLKRLDLRRIRDLKSLILTPLAMARLVWWGSVPFAGAGKRRSFAAHHVGEFPLTWALMTDVALPRTLLPRLLYAIALWHFRRATSRHGGFVTKEVFHQMRRCEVQLNLLRGQPFDRMSHQVSAVDEILRHCRYLNGGPDCRQRDEQPDVPATRGAMRGDAARGVHLILEAMRSALEGQHRVVREVLDEAWCVFKEARYGSGLYRVQIYEWILCGSKQPSWRTLLRAPHRLRHALRLRNWYAQGNRLVTATERPELWPGRQP